MSEIKTSNITENEMFKALTKSNVTIRKLGIKLDKVMDTNIQLIESNKQKDQTIASLSAQVANLTEQLLISQKTSASHQNSESNQDKDRIIASLSAQVADLTEQLLISQQSNQAIKEQLQSMNQRLFGRKSKKS